MNTDELKLLSKNQIPIHSKQLDRHAIGFLVKTLEEEDYNARYNAFLMLQEKSWGFHSPKSMG